MIPTLPRRATDGRPSGAKTSEGFRPGGASVGSPTRKRRERFSACAKRHHSNEPPLQRGGCPCSFWHPVAVMLRVLASVTPGARMPTLTIEYQTEAERLILEQALAFFAQMRQVAATAADGTVLAACERVALDSGRRLVRD